MERIATMVSKAIFYHAGCPVCVDAERQFAESLDPKHYEVEIVHLGQSKARIAEAEAAGVKSVPAFVIDGRTYHINFGADLAALK
jgi:glutaredoxin